MSKKKIKAQHVSIPVHNVPQHLDSMNDKWWFVLIALAITFLCFYSSVKNGFVNWDDDRNVYENPLIADLSSKSIKAIFTTPIIGNYNPLPILTFAIENKFFGMNPQAMHWTNLLLHLLCVFFVYRILLLLKLRPEIALIGTILFGIHPLRVESVAWITERKDVLYAAFFFPAVYLYIQNLYFYSKKRSYVIYTLFCIGLFAKIQMVSLPLTFIVLDYFFQKPVNIKSIFSKWPYFLGSMLFGLLGIYFLKGQGSLESNTNFNLFERLFIGSYSLFVYIVKWLVPYRMSPMYPYDEKLTVWHYISLPAAIALLYLMYFLWKKKQTEIIFGFGFFFMNIVFLLQILGAGQGYLADRFTYVAYFGLFYIFCYGLQELLIKNPKLNIAYFSITGIYLAALFMVSIKQIKIWKNSETLWTKVIEYSPNTSLPYNNRANYYRDLKQFDKALADYSQAIVMKAGHGTYNSRAKLYFTKGENQKALEDYNKAIELNPTAEYFVNRGAVYANLNQLDLALNDLNKGLQMDPKWKVGYLNRSILYNSRGDFASALNDIDAYLKLDTKSADMWYEGARCLRALNRSEQAIEYYNQAIRYKSDGAVFYLERGRTYRTLGNHSAAQADFTIAQQLGIPASEINK